MEQGNILARHIFELAHGEEPAKGAFDIVTDLILIAREVLHAHLEIARKERSKAVVVIADELTKKVGWQEIPALTILFHDDLCQN